jgi:hypothetical protein
VILDDPRQHPEQWRMPATRRLPYDAAALVRQFYDFAFDATAKPGERAILASSGGKGTVDRVIDALARNSVAALTIPTPDEGPPMLALALSRSLREKVMVDTPERWQGLERPLMILVHPLSGVSPPHKLRP